MLPNMKKNADGGVTLYIQKDSAGKDKQANWLPAPYDLISVVMRLYRYGCTEMIASQVRKGLVTEQDAAVSEATP
jgi:hypothetical protein